MLAYLCRLGNFDHRRQKSGLRLGLFGMEIEERVSCEQGDQMSL
jgi:hypothetical protein